MLLFVGCATAGSAHAPKGADKEKARQVIRAHHEEILQCHEQALRRDPGLSGTVSMTWQIETSGSVSNVSVSSSNTTLRDPALHACMAGRIATWSFPSPSSGGIAIVTYPWHLRPASTPEAPPPLTPPASSPTQAPRRSP